MSAEKAYVAHIGQNEEGIIDCENCSVLGMVSGSIQDCAVLLSQSTDNRFIILQHYDQTTDPSSFEQLESNLDTSFNHVTLVLNERFNGPSAYSHVHARLLPHLTTREVDILYTSEQVRGVFIDNKGNIDPQQTTLPIPGKERSPQNILCGNPFDQSGRGDKECKSANHAEINQYIANLNLLFNIDKPIFRTFQNGELSEYKQVLIPEVKNYILEVEDLYKEDPSKWRNIVARKLIAENQDGMFGHNIMPNLDTHLNEFLQVFNAKEQYMPDQGNVVEDASIAAREKLIQNTGGLQLDKS